MKRKPILWFTQCVIHIINSAIVDVTRTVDPLASLPEPNCAEIKYGIIVRFAEIFKWGLVVFLSTIWHFLCATLIFHVAGGRCSLILDLWKETRNNFCDGKIQSSDRAAQIISTFRPKHNRKKNIKSNHKEWFLSAVTPDDVLGCQKPELSRNWWRRWVVLPMLDTLRKEHHHHYCTPSK